MQKRTAFAKGNFYSLFKIKFQTNWLFIMKLTVCCGAILLCTLTLLASTRTSAQSLHGTKIIVEAKNESLKSALEKLQDKSGFNLFYPSASVEKYRAVTIDNKPRDVAEILDILLNGTGLIYHQEGSKIIIAQGSQKNNAAPDAAPRRISGIVLDENAQPIPGVTVMIKSDKYSGTATDQNGQFHIDIKDENDVLVFTMVGYVSQELAAKNMGSGRVIMKAAVGTLNEVIVIGYGTATRKDLTGAVSSITSTDITKQPVQDPLNALEGRLPGAQITQSSGLPGAAVKILVRGQNSLSAGTVPLYVIDGVPFNINDGGIPASNSLNSFGVSGANGQVSPFSIINPNDIDRIDILKDADATAIYGARGGNGVVLITTKKGKAGKTKVDLNLYQGIGKVAHFIPMMNTQQYLQLRAQGIKNDGFTPDPNSDPDLLSWDTTKYTNWQKKYIGGTAHLTDAQASISGGNENTRFIFTNGFHRETTVYPGDYTDQKFTSRFNLDHNSNNKKFNLNLSVNYSYDFSLLPVSDLSSAYKLPPNYPLYNPDGSIFWDPGGNFTNPQSYLLQKNINKTNSLISNLQLRYTVLPGLDLKLNAGYNNVTLSQNSQMPYLSQNPLFGTPLNSAQFGNNGQSFYSIEPQINYKRNISKGELTVLAGGTLQRSVNNNVVFSAIGYSNPDLMSTPAGAANYNLYSSSNVLYKFSSVFGRATYNWDGKYIINGTIRTDGSSRFGADHPFGTFYSVGGAWIFTNEKFIENSLPLLSFGKLKASYGLTGNDQIGDYQYLPTYSTSSGSYSYQGNSTLYVSRIPNPQLAWESDKKLDIGLDLGVFKDRILLSADYYENRSSNQLGYLILAIQSGQNSYAGNLPALILNKGFEFQLNTTNISGKGFTWKTSLNLTVPKSKLLSVSPSYFYATEYVLGYPITQLKVFDFVGVDPQTGQPNFKTAAGTITTNPDYSTDRTVIEDASPKFYGGISNDFTYKNFSLSFFFQVTKQNGVVYSGVTPGSLAAGNGYAYQTGIWSAPGSTSQFPLATTNPYTYQSTYGTSNAVWGDNSFVKLKNVSLSYNLPATVVKKMGMSQLRIFTQGQNLYTWTKNKITLDPETGTSMFTGSAVLPPLRVITLGLNATF
jgi:TonB-linked SusC/RagA family outer membrane protein